jgi:hypothetical protein
MVDDETFDRVMSEIDAARTADPGGLRATMDLLDVIDGIVDETHPEGDGCPLCVALDDLRAALAPDATAPETKP